MLINIKQGLNKTLREFIKRFVTTLQAVDNPLDEVAIFVLQSALKPNNFPTKLARKPPNTLSKAINRAYRKMEVEEMLEGKFKEARGKTLSIQKFNTKLKGNIVRT